MVFGHWWSPCYKGFQKMKSGEVFCPFLKRSLAEHASPVEFHASCHETSVFILFRDAPNFSFIIVQKVCRMSIDKKSLKISKISLVFKEIIIVFVITRNNCQWTLLPNRVTTYLKISESDYRLTRILREAKLTLIGHK